MSSLSATKADKKQAEKAARGTPSHGNKNDGLIHSSGSLRIAKQAFKLCSAFCREYGFKQEKFNNITKDTVEKYLQHRATEIQQKQLNVERGFLNKHLGRIHNKEVQIPFIKSTKPEPVIKNKSYSHDHIKRLIHQAKVDGNRDLAASIVLTYKTGMRAEELFTIQPPGIGQASPHRKEDWKPEIYTGRESWVSCFIDKGKGGLDREVRYTDEITPYLESRLRNEPEKVFDKNRETSYTSHYKLLAGQKFSAAFTKLSQKVFGWSIGAHALRHSFAQARLIELKNHFPHEFARQVLAQELGHFDTSNLRYYGV